jgi:hypothetical protein
MSSSTRRISGPAPVAQRRTCISQAARLLLALALMATLTPPITRAATQLLRVTPTSKANFLQLQALAPELGTCGVTSRGDAIEFPAAEGRADELRGQGFVVDVQIPNLESFYADRLGRRINFGAYHTYTEAIQAMDDLASAYSNVMSPKQSIGTTVQGLPIWAYKISDNPGVDEGEAQIFFNAYIHAREPITFEVVYDLAEYLVTGYGTDPRATQLVNTREIWIEPVVNPDGVEYNLLTDPNGGGMWRKNRRHNNDGSYGVDLNRNFGYMWGYDDNGSSPYGSDETYRGTSAFSEPETQAMRNFVNPRRFRTAVNNHAYAGLNLYAYGYDAIHAPDNEAMFTLGRMRRALNSYNTGTAWECLYSTNGDAVDWMYGDSFFRPRILAFVTEIGNDSDGFWPAESRIPALKAENREANLRLIELADNPFRILPPGVPAIALPDTVPPTFTVAWTIPHPDADNPATVWNLVEATGYTVGTDNLEGNNANRWGADGWALSTSRYHSSNHSYYSGSADSQNNLFMSKRGHRVAAGEQLRFWTWYRIENAYDYGYVEVSTDTRGYVPIAGSITTTSDPNNRNFGNGITGSSPGWVQATFDLSGFAGQTICLRFRYNTDRYTTEEGWYVDDVSPADLFTTETTVAGNLSSAQYAFQNHAEGSFAYLVQSVDAEGDLSIWSAPEPVTIRNVAVGVDSPSPLTSPWNGLELAGANPFEGSAQFRFTVPSSGRTGEPVLLTVHDVSGRRVATLRESAVGSAAEPGATMQDSWTPGDRPIGLYFARLRVGNRTSEQRLIYLK